MKLSRYFFPFFALFVIFADELFLSFGSVTGIVLVSGMKSRMAIVIAAIAYTMLFVDFLQQKLTKRNFRQLVVLLVIMVLYYVTSLFYQPSIDNYWTHLLVYGALCVPASYVGMKMARTDCEEPMMKMLPFFVMFIVFAVSRAVLTMSFAGSILQGDDDDAFNYQTASYYLSFCFAYCFFYVFFLRKDSRLVHNKNVLNIIITIIMLALMFVCAVGCLMGGGRGAFVFLIAISAYLVFRVMGRGGKNNTRYIFLLLIGVLFLIYIANRLDIFESAGFLRVSSNLTNDDHRASLWNRALQVFSESPIYGHGLGSIWWTVGFYSHNMLTDLLAETGIVGALVVVTVLVKIVITLVKRSYLSTLDMFMLIVMAGALVEDTFSGYWISSGKLFLMFGYVYGLRTRKVIKVSNK